MKIRPSNPRGRGQAKSHPPLSRFDPATYGRLALVHSPVDEWSRPGLTNFLGGVQVDGEPTALAHPMFHPVSGSEERTCFLSIGGVLLAAAGVRTEVRWCPWQVSRMTEWDGWRIETVTVMPWGMPCVVQRIRIRNTSRKSRVLDAGLRLSGRCVRDEAGVWAWDVPVVSTDVYELLTEHGLYPMEFPIGDSGRLWKERKNPQSKDPKNPGWNAQCLHPKPDRWNAGNGDACYEVALKPGGEWVVDFALAMGTSRKVADCARQAVVRVPELIVATEKNWRGLWKEAFVPGNRAFSGHLPDLSLPADIAPVATSAVLNLLVCRRQKGTKRGYIILTPRRCEAGFFIWDWGLATPVLARLDPVTVKRQLGIVLASDFRAVNQYDLWKGRGRGWPYAANPCMVFLAAHSLWQALGGTRRALATRCAPGAPTLLEAMEDCAGDHRSRIVKDLGLADFGPKADLLECVTTYAHVVAGLNAAAAGMLVQLAKIHDLLGRNAEAARARAEAQTLADRIVEHLYVPGGGFFRCIHPDGRSYECRSAFDVAMVLWQAGELLPESVRAEIVAFIVRELQTPSWCRALSAADRDAGVSGVRADHQYSGSYTAWPALLAFGLLKSGRRDLVARWLPGIARTALQGPFGQGHWDERLVPPTAGGATKVTDSLPQGCHWCDISGAIYFSLVEAFMSCDPKK